MHQLIVTLCTCPDKGTAETIARHLVSAGLAGCVNILPNLTSVYAWNGDLETAEEHLLLIKSGLDAYKQLEDAIRSLHPYELPEIISLPVTHALPEYVNWILQCHTES